MYNLLFVEGINAIDTYAFKTEQDQRDFFEGAVVVSIDEYYPPHYSNRIRLSTDIVPLSTNFNYLSLMFDNKYYYYFITGINYINEVVYEIEIEMDTIQTLMFNTYFLNLKVNKMSIKRWQDIDTPIINRDYVRENLSEEDYDLASYEQSQTPDFGLFIIQVSEYHGSLPSAISPAIDYENFESRTSLTDGLIYYVLPVPLKDLGLINTYEVGTHSIGVNTSQLRGAIERIISLPYTVNVYFINNSGVCNGLEYSISNNKVSFSSGALFKIDPNVNPVFFEYDTGSGIYSTLPAFRVDEFNPNWIDTYGLQPHNFLDVNRNLGVAFSAQFVPYLLDENYVDYEFGERMKTTHFPLHQCLLLELKKRFKFDINSCIRSYKIDAVTRASDGKDDEYMTTITCDSSPSMPLLTDSWLDYYCRNKANYSELGISTQIANILWGGVSGNASNVAKTAITGQAMRNSGFTQIMNAVDTKNPQGINTGANTMLNGHMWSNLAGVQAKIGLANTGVQLANYSVDFDLTKMNVSYAPDTYTSGKNPFNDVFTQANQVIERISIVRDYLNVAKRIEYYGYRVNIYKNYSNGSLLSDMLDLFPRYYYNVLQISECTLKFNMFVADDLKHNLIARLRAGIRLFSTYYTNTSIGDSLNYDNVETDFVQNP